MREHGTCGLSSLGCAVGPVSHAFTISGLGVIAPLYRGSQAAKDGASLPQTPNCGGPQRSGVRRDAICVATGTTIKYELPC